MGAPNTIARLPKDVREALHGYLRDPGITQREATGRANALLGELGLPPLSKSAVNRYDIRMRAAGERLQQTREVAEVWIGKLGAVPQGQLGALAQRTAANAGVRHRAEARGRTAYPGHAACGDPAAAWSFAFRRRGSSAPPPKTSSANGRSGARPRRNS